MKLASIMLGLVLAFAGVALFAANASAKCGGCGDKKAATTQPAAKGDCDKCEDKKADADKDGCGKCEDKKTDAAAAKPINTICPVEGGKVNPKYTYVYQGKTIGFCCGDCLPEFKKDPEKYMKNLK
jgi:YHS domain-containing protein